MPRDRKEVQTDIRALERRRMELVEELLQREYFPRLMAVLEMDARIAELEAEIAEMRHDLERAVTRNTELLNEQKTWVGARNRDEP